MTRQYAVYINRPAYPGRGCYVAAKRTDWYRGSHLPGGGLDWRETLPPRSDDPPVRRLHQPPGLSGARLLRRREANGLVSGEPPPRRRPRLAGHAPPPIG